MLMCGLVMAAGMLAGCGVGSQPHAVVIPSDAVPSGLLEPAESPSASSSVEVPTSTIYLVDNDSLIAVHRPRTLAALGDLHGVGPVKTERFGARFVAAVSEDQT